MGDAPFLMAVIAAAWGAPRFHLDHMDRLVTTTMRECMGFPISSWRDAQTCIFDISVLPPFLGRCSATAMSPSSLEG